MLLSGPIFHRLVGETITFLTPPYPWLFTYLTPLPRGRGRRRPLGVGRQLLRATGPMSFWSDFIFSLFGCLRTQTRGNALATRDFSQRSQSILEVLFNHGQRTWLTGAVNSLWKDSSNSCHSLWKDSSNSCHSLGLFSLLHGLRR